MSEFHFYKEIEKVINGKITLAEFENSFENEIDNMKILKKLIFCKDCKYGDESIYEYGCPFKTASGGACCGGKLK